MTKTLSHSVFEREAPKGIPKQSSGDVQCLMGLLHFVRKDGLFKSPLFRGDLGGNLFLFLLFSLLLFPLSAISIEVGGHITEDTVWTPENNPYHVIDFLYIDANATLTILPGTIVKIKSARLQFPNDTGLNFWMNNGETVAKMIRVYGKIIAVGTEQDSIVFTRDQDIENYHWGTILLDKTSEGLSIFKYCKFKYNHMIGLSISEAFDGAVSPDNGKVIIENCLIQDPGRYGIRLQESIESVLIKNNIFNLSIEPYIPATNYIYIDIPQDNFNSPPFIVGNYFLNYNGIVAQNGYPMYVANNNFYDCNWCITTNNLSFSYPTYIYNNEFQYINYFAIENNKYVADTLYIRKNKIFNGSYYNQIDFPGGCSNFDISYNFLDSCSIHIQSNPPNIGKIYNNIVQNDGNDGGDPAGIYAPSWPWGDHIEIYNNIVANCAVGYGIAANPKFYNNIAINNTVAVNSGAPIMENCIFIGNEQFYQYFPAGTIRNCVLDFPIPEEYDDGGGNIWQDPMFVDAENGDYRLLPESPCIDAGFDTLASYYPLFDLDHNFRIWDGNGDGTERIDIGPYEYGSQYTGGIEGVVYEYGTEHPVDYVLLKLNNQNSQFEFADSSGYFHFDVPPGTYDLYAERVFYDDVVIPDIEVVAGQVMPINFSMVNTTGIIDKVNFTATPKSIIMYNYPNPFNPSTTIAFTIPQDGGHLQGGLHLTLNTYDVSGKLVKTLIDGEMEAGYHSVVWDGKDEHGKEVASGVYFYRLNSRQFNQTNKMLLLK